MYKHILVPVAPDHPPNSGRAIEIAQSLLDEGGRITAITVVEAIPAYVSQQIPSDIMEGNRDAMEATLKAELGGVKGVSTSVVTGHAATTILDQAEMLDVDCIVIASHRPGLIDYFLGSTAGRVVRHAKCAVHVLR
jgi:nucleotide-binding universal stress UspA family protein